MTRLATITWPKDAYRKRSASMLAGCMMKHASDYHMEADA
jgi:hypothetical protein